MLAITDGRTIVTLPPGPGSQGGLRRRHRPQHGRHGRLLPGARWSMSEMLRSIEEHILVPTVHAMKRSRQPFNGVLYAGLMLTPAPGTQGARIQRPLRRPRVPAAADAAARRDLVELLEATIDGRSTRSTPLEWDPRPSVCVVMASEGYPGDYEKGRPIRGLDEAGAVPDVKVFHSGTQLVDGQVVTAGGRVLAVTALGNTIAAAKLQAYTAVKCIRWHGAWCRKDIADKAMPGGSAKNPRPR